MHFIKFRQLVFSIFFLTIIINGNAQPIVNSADAEQKSLQFYNKGDWAQLVKFGEKAISRGYDYFYLRVRVGIACFEQKKYLKAIKHFEKAIDFNSSDSLALEYLYYSYIFAGRGNDARALTAIFPESLKNRIKPPKNKVLESVYLEGGIGLSNLEGIYKTVDIDGQFDIYGETTITKNMSYGHIGTGHQLGNKWSLYQGYSNIRIKMLRDIKINNKDTFDTYHLTQHDYYISVIGQLKRFTISPAFHFINVNFGKLNARYDMLQNKYIFTNKDTSFINYSASLSVSRAIGIFTYGISMAYSHLNSYNQIQGGISVAYFPFSNTNFYGSSMLVCLNENNENRLVMGQKLGVKLLSKLWAEGGITYGNLQNYTENNSFVVFNTGDKIVYKYGVALLSPLTKNLQLSIRYDAFSRENSYYRMNNLYKIEPVSIDYITQTIVGGLKWTL